MVSYLEHNGELILISQGKDIPKVEVGLKEFSAYKGVPAKCCSKYKMENKILPNSS